MALPHLASMLLPLLVAGAPAQSPAANEAFPAAAVAAWQELSQVRSLEARFVQTRNTRLLTRPLESSGVLRFQRPDKLAWQVETPGRSLLVMDGTRVGMAYPDLGVREELDLTEQPEIAGLVQGMMVWLAGDPQQVQASYTMQWQPGPPQIALLTPRDATLAAIIAQLELRLEGEPLQVRHVRLVEPDGDVVEIALQDLSIDPELPADAFQLSAAEN